MVFPVVIYGCESWTIKKANHLRTNVIELWFGEDSWESLGLQGDQVLHIYWKVLKLKLQNFGHLMWRADSVEKLWCWERLKAEGEGDDRGWGGRMASPNWWTWVWVNSRSWWWTGKPGVLRFMGSLRVRHDWATELNWTEMVSLSLSFSVLWFFHKCPSDLIRKC